MESKSVKAMYKLLKLIPPLFLFINILMSSSHMTKSAVKTPAKIIRMIRDIITERIGV